MITPDDGMEISKVTVNGKEFTVTDNMLTGLKTEDKVEVTFAKIPPTKEYGLPCDTRFGCNFQYHPLRRMTCSKRTL